MYKIENNPLFGIISALIWCKIWNSQPDPPSVYINNWRIHHYQVGIALLLLGLKKKIPFLVASGMVFIVDDRIDFINDIEKLLKKRI